MVTGAARCDPECGASGPAVKGAPTSRRLRRFRSAPPLTPAPPPRLDLDPDGQGWGRRIRAGGPSPFAAGCGPVHRGRRPEWRDGPPRGQATRATPSRGRVPTGPTRVAPTVRGGSAALVAGCGPAHRGRERWSMCRLRSGASPSGTYFRKVANRSAARPPRQTQCAPGRSSRATPPGTYFGKVANAFAARPPRRTECAPVVRPFAVPGELDGWCAGRRAGCGRGARGGSVRNFPEVGAGGGPGPVAPSVRPGDHPAYGVPTRPPLSPRTMLPRMPHAACRMPGTVPPPTRLAHPARRTGTPGGAHWTWAGGARWTDSQLSESRCRRARPVPTAGGAFGLPRGARDDSIRNFREVGAGGGAARLAPRGRIGSAEGGARPIDSQLFKSRCRRARPPAGHSTSTMPPAHDGPGRTRQRERLTHPEP